MSTKLQTFSVKEFDSLLEKQGVRSSRDNAFICPACDTVQSMRSLVMAGCSKEKVADYIGFSCEGRFSHGQSPTVAKERNNRGCNWTLGGLFQIHKVLLKEGDQTQPHFAAATPEAARDLEKHLIARKHKEIATSLARIKQAEKNAGEAEKNA